jgi:hypothetical protein
LPEAELARDIHAVPAKVQEGFDVIVEQDHRPVAVIKPPQGPGRKISECIALAKAYEEKPGCVPVPDPDFAKDAQASIDAHSEPFGPPSWDYSSTSGVLIDAEPNASSVSEPLATIQ